MLGRAAMRQRNCTTLVFAHLFGLSFERFQTLKCEVVSNSNLNTVLTTMDIHVRNRIASLIRSDLSSGVGPPRARPTAHVQSKSDERLRCERNSYMKYEPQCSEV